MPPHRHTKIVATLGPATDSPEMIEALLRAGVDLFRLNFSHSDHATHALLIATIRLVEAYLQRPIAILQDLKGPEIRTRDVADTFRPLHQGEHVVLAPGPGPIQGTGPLFITFEHLAEDVHEGQRVFIDDGSIALMVEAVMGVEVHCRVERGGVLKSRKGVNFPGANLSLPFLTDKDYADLDFGIENGVDIVAASFVRSGSDVRRVRDYIRERGSKAMVMAKIETRQAVDNLEEVIREADAVMVARGDLGVEIPVEKVPMVQKRIIDLAVHLGKPVLTATHMLESMTHHAYPTRAEVTDGANAVLDGTDAVMLSGETANGEYPVESVLTMVRVIQEAEGVQRYQPAFQEWEPDLASGIGRAACVLAQSLKAQAILCPTASGATARRIAMFRPERPIVALSVEPLVLRQLLLSHGVFPIRMRAMESLDQMVEDSHDLAVETGFVKAGDVVVQVFGLPVGVAGSTNTIQVHRIEG